MADEQELFDDLKPKNKVCPFCAETIQAAAIKCRYCGEFLDTDLAKEAERKQHWPGPAQYLQQSEPAEQVPPPQDVDKVLLYTRPSLLGLVGMFIKGAIFLALGIFLMAYRFEDLTAFENVSHWPITQIRMVTGLGIAIVVLLYLTYASLRLKMIEYTITTDRIEYCRGVLDRRVDNLDMFRVIDLKLRRSLLDVILGIGSVTLTTTDKSDPSFTFEKLKHPRKLYDIVKKSSLQADQKQRVIHME